MALCASRRWLVYPHSCKLGADASTDSGTVRECVSTAGPVSGPSHNPISQLILARLIIHHPIYEAGLFLADDGRSECLACVAGLRQYSTAFPQFWETTDEIELRYSAMIARTTRLEKSNSGIGQVLSDGKERMASMQSGSWPSKGGENRSSTLVCRSFCDAREYELILTGWKWLYLFPRSAEQRWRQ